MAKVIEKTGEIAGKTLTLTTGKIANQTSAAVVARMGDTVVLATVVASPNDADKGYFPLTVDYMERLYAGGKIKGSRWVKREGKPTDEEILSGRLIDRSVRPLFPKTYMKEVQLVLMVMSVDGENNPQMVAALAASAAFTMSPLPFLGPVAVVSVGHVDGQLVAYPTQDQMDKSDLNLVVSSTKDAVLMIESGAKQVSEEKVLEAIKFAKDEGLKVNTFIAEFAEKAGREKVKTGKDAKYAEVKKAVDKKAKTVISDLLAKMSTKESGYAEYDAAIAAVAADFEPSEVGLVKAAFEELFKEEGRQAILSGKRPDGRKLTEIRQLSAEIGVLPRTHGSAVFSRGQTQVMSVATLANHTLEQVIETAEGEESKRYMHHYSMPPYANGEVGRIGSPNRREIGHGALAERALEPVIPSENDFPYTIRIVSEVMSSNGSTSMASVCGSTLSLMDAGVPLVAPVAGIAMGLVVEDEKKFSVLTDITGLEDQIGDMDFKVAGTKDGITALQLDVKTLNLTVPILVDAVAQAKKARMEILTVIENTIAAPRPQVSQYAPKIKRLTIPVDKIGELIGPGGRTIKGLIAQTGAEIDVEDDGTVFVSAVSEESLTAAVTAVEGLTKDVLPGEIYDGTVKRVENYGAFVEILPGKEGLVHVSRMGAGFVADPSTVVKVGDTVKVRVNEVDDLGRINLSMNMDPSLDNKGRGDGEGGNGGDRNGGSRGPRRFDNRRGGPRRFDNRGGRGDHRPRFGNQERSGPHFPATSLMPDLGKRDH